MNASERAKLADRAVAIDRKLRWLWRRYGFHPGDMAPTCNALQAELTEINRRLAADAAEWAAIRAQQSVIPFRRSA